MKKILAVIITLAIGYWLIQKFLFSRKPTRLDEHLSEQKNLKDIGKATGLASILARPILAMIGQRPKDGAVETPFSPEDDGDTSTEFLPDGYDGTDQSVSYEDDILAWN
ncbi:MAG: hypothetical protein HY299_09875 [Verrucomicrobia bacterium]|nr:hypothetical protein [Verrucomicrobiota bacterium]